LDYLVTVSSLEVRDGSALAACEIAHGLRRRGHGARLFSLKRGAFAQWAEEAYGLQCLSFDDLQSETISPDRIILFHWPTYFALLRAGISAPTVFGFLGNQPPLENPPPLPVGLSFPWFAVSEASQRNVSNIAGWSSATNTVVRNWTSWDERPIRADGPLRRVAIVSNRMTDELEERFRAATQRASIELVRFGLPKNPQVLDADMLSEFDAIVSLGRTVLDAMRIGRPALIYDIHGADGWVTPEVVRDRATESFSGRRNAHVPSDAELDEWLSNPPTSNELSALQQWVSTTATLDLAIDQIDGLFATATQQQISWGHFGEVPVELYEEVATLKKYLSTREEQVRKLNAQREIELEHIRKLEEIVARVRPKWLVSVAARLPRRSK
jgi:hypothetical protein